MPRRDAIHRVCYDGPRCPNEFRSPVPSAPLGHLVAPLGHLVAPLGHLGALGNYVRFGDVEKPMFSNSTFVLHSRYPSGAEGTNTKQPRAPKQKRPFFSEQPLGIT